MGRRAVVLTASALLIVLLAHECGRQPPLTPISAPENLKLAPSEQEKVVVDMRLRTVYVVTPTEIKKIEGVRAATVTIKKDGTVEVKARSYGLCLEPGLGVVVARGIEPSIDIQFAYWRRLGAVVGVVPYPHTEPYIGLSYELSALHLPNTSIVAGYGLRNLIVGVRLSF